MLGIKQQLKLMLWVLEKCFVRILIFKILFASFFFNFKIRVLKWIFNDLKERFLIVEIKLYSSLQY